MISSIAIEYVTRDLFKGKSLKSSCNKFIKKFGGQEATFIGIVDYTAVELAESVLKDKLSHYMKDTEPAKVDAKLEALAGHFNLPLEELKQVYNKEISKC